MQAAVHGQARPARGLSVRILFRARKGHCGSARVQRHDGKLTVVGYTQNDVDVWAEIAARSLAMAGVTKDSLVHVAYGYGLFTGGLGAHYGAQKIGASTVPASAGNTIRQLTLLRDFGATHLCCTPSYAIFLGTEIQKAGMDIRISTCRAALSGRNPGRTRCATSWKDCSTSTRWTFTGFPRSAARRGDGVYAEKRSHIQEDHFIPEIIDPETLEPLPFGSEGNSCSPPSPRRDSRSSATARETSAPLSDEKCACGRTTVKMSKVKGRSDDMLIIRGVNVFPSQIEAAIMNVSGVSPHYMIYVDRINNLDVMEIDIELAGNLTPDRISDIESIKKESGNGSQFVHRAECKDQTVRKRIHSAQRRQSRARHRQAQLIFG